MKHFVTFLKSVPLCYKSKTSVEYNYQMYVCVLRTFLRGTFKNVSL